MPRLAALLPLLCLVGNVGGQDRKLEPKALFDGKTFAGWDGDTQRIWRIEAGCIVGGSLTNKIPRNEFLATTASFGDFTLKLKFKLLGDTTKGFVNSGVQIRSERDPNSSEMIGYQADIGDPTWWGCLYDESRRNKVLAQSDMKSIGKVLKRGDWNDYEIRAKGKRIRAYINGALAVDYTEPDDSIPQAGRIGLQIHSGGPAEVWFKDIVIEELPATKPPGFGAPPPPGPPGKSPLTAEEQQKTFSLPAGYEMELVASEPDIGKPITVAWDHAGRLWTMTALEYPLDANENPERSKELFEKGGRDCVLVFDNPYGPGPHKPRTFADGLAIPLGLLPYKEGCFVQYGRQILFLRDTDGDGKADQREVFLEGIGTEDSHLFPHQFTRGPGGWLYFAQGAFNHSRVKTKEGPTVRMSYCKMARVQLDGSGFELVEAGLNNIWGFVISSAGDMFIQEANDLGYPVVPFELGANFPGIGMEKLKPYAPWTPTLPHSFQLGGTGLSGLALIESATFGAPLSRSGPVFLIANPIMRKVQTVALEPAGQDKRLVLLPDFVQSSDPWFRPVAIHFGPDECLYIVDWYNSIISHNEVPRNHPERDKTRGRIWRVRRSGSSRQRPVDLTQLADEALIDQLASSNAWQRRSAWQEIVDRKAVRLAPVLETIVQDNGRSEEHRLAALWGLEGLHAAPLAVVRHLIHGESESRFHLRREAVRVVGTQGYTAKDIVTLLNKMPEDPSPAVRAAAIRTLASIKTPPDETLQLLIRFAKSDLEGPLESLQQGGTAKLGAAHDRAFERYLVRAALERHPHQLANLLITRAGEDLPAENLALAALALDSVDAARFLAKLLPTLARPPNEEELLRLLQYADDAGIARLIGPVFARPSALRALLEQRSRIDAQRVRPFLVEPARQLWKSGADSDLAAHLVAAFQIQELEPEFVATLDLKMPSAQRRLAARALREIGSQRSDVFLRLLEDASADVSLREEAVHGLAGSLTPNIADQAFPLLSEFTARERQLFLSRLANTPAGAKLVVDAFQRGFAQSEHLDAALVEKLQLILRDDPRLAVFLRSQDRFVRAVLRLDGGNADYVNEPITLSGSFTVECWVRLDPGISNADSILGRPGVADFNFHDARLRVWGGPQVGDLVIAKRPMIPGAWTHVAVTRDMAGRFAIYVNGELDTAEGRSSLATWNGLRIGQSNPGRGTRAALDEFRLWETARSAEEIRATFDHSLSGLPRPKGLALVYGGASWGQLHGNARITRTTDYPPVLSPEQAKALAGQFALYRNIIQQAGDRGAGLAVFDKNCRNCHIAEGRGGQVGPTLNGVGATHTDAILRNLLTPSAAIEPGYRLFRVELVNGVIKEGFLVRQSETEITLRRPDEQDEVIPGVKVRHAGFTRRSVMPDGLLDALKPAEVRDLFAYLHSLK